MNLSSDPINTLENLISKNKTKSISIYLVLVLDILKGLDATIKYCKKKESFYYDKPFELVLQYSLKTIVDEEIREIFGGGHFRPILSDGSILNLY